MQQYDLPKEQPFEDLLTCPIMIDGRGINQRLREQHREWIKRQRAQELSIKRFIIRWAGRAFRLLYKFIWAYSVGVVIVLGWVYDFITSQAWIRRLPVRSKYKAEGTRSEGGTNKQNRPNIKKIRL